MENLIEAMSLRGYAQVDLGDGKISFRRTADAQNKGDTQGWTFQYDNWDAVRESLIDIPLWESEEMTKRIDALIGLTEEEQIARMISKYNEVYDESGRLNTVNVNPHMSINKGSSSAEYEIDYWHRHFMYAYSFEETLRVAVQIDLLEKQLDVIELSNEQIRKIIEKESGMSLETIFPVIEKEFRKMTYEDMKNYIHYFLKKHEPELICTSRVLDSLATTVIKMIDSGQIVDPQVEVNELLVKDHIINFIKQRIPLVEKVSVDVQESVKVYFQEHLKNFTPMEICRSSNHPEDDNLYAVIAKKSNGEYACWTSWHQGRESMNYGHYGLPDREIAFSIIRDNFNDISDEIKKYGPEKSLITVDTTENIEKQENGKAVVVPFVNRSRGR